MSSDTRRSKSAKERLFQKDFPPGEFKERRKKIMDGIGLDACALLQGMPQVKGFYRFSAIKRFLLPLRGWNTARVLADRQQGSSV